MASQAKVTRDDLLSAFDRIGLAALENGARIEVAVFGGSALMLASNFRYASEDADVSLLDQPWPGWLTTCVTDIARERGLDPDWFNNAVEFHLSLNADKETDLLNFGTFPRDGDEVGLSVSVPSAEYMLAMKLKAMRINDPTKGPQEAADILNLMQVCGISVVDEAIALLARYYPKSAANADKQAFLLRHLLTQDPPNDAPVYPVRSL